MQTFGMKAKPRRVPLIDDPVDVRILQALESSGRMSHAELGRRLNLSAPAVAERIARLTDRGVLRGFRAIIDPAAVGRDVGAIIEFTPYSTDVERVVVQIRLLDEIVSAWRVTGTAFLILHVRVGSTGELNAFLMKLAQLGQTKTSMTLQVEIDDRPLLPLDPEAPPPRAAP